jgi:hypothetical protein
VSNAEFETLNGVTSAIQVQLDAKQATITGGASTIASTDLTVSRALISNAVGKVAVATTTSTELGYVNGVTSAIQTQLDAKQATLVSGTNIKTINSTSLLGSGDIVINAAPSGVSGAIQFSNGSAFASDASNLFWDDTNNRLGVGTNTPSATGHFKGSGSTSATTSLLVQNSSGVASLQVLDDTSVFNNGKGAVANNTAFGNGALINNTSGNLNTAVGFEALRNNTSGTFNTANGSSALRNNTSGTFNTANGVNALSANTTGGDNTANGVNALVFNTTGGKNTAIGRSALQSNTASNNTALGYEAGVTNTSGTGITAIGYQALKLSTGADNTALGFQAGDNITTGAGNVCIGSGAEPLAATDSNQFVVGSSTINAGSVVTESNSSTKVWNVIINGVAQKILLA